jgi:hypothetical protein
MPSLSGVRSNASVKIGSTFGTAVSGGAGNKIKAEIAPSVNSDWLTRREIGSGAVMASGGRKGLVSAAYTLTMDAGFRNSMDVIMAQLFGTSGAPTQVTVGQGDYRHTLTVNSSANAKWLTFAYETASATVVECPSCAVRSLTLSTQKVPGYLDFSAELLANQVLLTGTTNTNASIQAATITDTELVAADPEDEFWLNTASGAALSTSDRVKVTSYSLTLSRPQEHMGEIKGAAGNSEPVETGLMEGELTLTLKDNQDHTFFTHWNSETILKSKLNLQGSQIGSGTNRSVSIYIPCMQLMEFPDYPISGPGINPVTLKFKIYAASAAPSGMTSTLPYAEIVNTLATSLLA